MTTKGIGPQGLGIKGHKGLWIGDASTKDNTKNSKSGAAKMKNCGGSKMGNKKK